MLQLTRKQNESIIIGGDIEITVLNDPQGHVRVGIEAPDDIEIWREEIYEKSKKDPESDMKIKIILMVAMLTISGTANAVFTLKHYHEFKGEDEFETYLTGLGRGISWANRVLEANKRPPLFCQPKNLALDSGIIQSIIAQEIRQPTDGASYSQDMPVELIAVLAFMNKFPCGEINN